MKLKNEVVIRNDCKQCGTKWSRFTNDRKKDVDWAIGKQKEYIATLHVGHSYKLTVTRK